MGDNCFAVQSVSKRNTLSALSGLDRDRVGAKKERIIGYLL